MGINHQLSKQAIIMCSVLLNLQREKEKPFMPLEEKTTTRYERIYPKMMKVILWALSHSE